MYNKLDNEKISKTDLIMLICSDEDRRLLEDLTKLIRMFHDYIIFNNYDRHLILV
jgi:hypothetical protein